MWKDYLHLHFIVLLWGFTSILGKEISLDSTVIVFYRTGIASVALLAIILMAKRKLAYDSKTTLKFLFTGFLVCIHWMAFFASVKVSKVSICLAGISTVTLFTSFLEPLMRKTKIKWYEIMLGVFVIAGLYTIFRFEFDHALGLALALVAAILAAIFSIMNKTFTDSHPPMPITFYEMVGACLCSIILIPIYQYYSGESLTLLPTQLDWGYLLLLSLVCTVYAFYFSVKILKKMSAFNVNLSINMEPVYGIILAFLIYGEAEEMSPQFYLGTGIILLSVIVYPFLEKRFGKTEEENPTSEIAKEELVA